MNDFYRAERARAYSRALTHLNHALAHLRAAEHENRAFHLGLQLPNERDLLAAINQCDHVYQQPPESPL